MNNPGRPRPPGFYHPLAPEFARVFELEPGEFSDPIVGRLVPQAIDGEAYEAVSYVWGDPRKRRDITINGATLSVTENLHGALTAFRHRPRSGSGDGSDPTAGTDPGPASRQVRRLWVDAVCINQDDLPERVSQVEQMARIYAGARRVLAWLGWEKGEDGRRHTRDAIRFIHAFMEDPEAGLHDARILLLHHDVADPAGHLALLSEDDRNQYEEQTRQWEAVKVFFDIEYFHRTWIVQELGLAREAIMYTTLQPAESKGRDLELDFVDWPLVGRFVKFLDYSGALLVTQLGLMSWVAHHILMVWEMKEDGTPECDFLTAMHWARILRVTDARDRVYGLLGHPMAVISGHLVIKPDYAHTRGVIYTRLAANLIRKTNNLYVVSLVDHEDDPSVEARNWDPHDEGRMPSWVPDWHSINRTTPLDYPIAAAESEHAEIRIEGDTAGTEETRLPHLLVRGWTVDEVSAVSRRMETADFPVTHLARERAKENPFWLDRVWEMVFLADGPTDGDALAVLETLSLALPLGTRERDQWVSKAGSNQTLEKHRRSFAAYVLEYHELRRGASEASGIDDNDNSYMPARSLFDTLPPEAQAELRRRAEGATSRGFLECMTWPSMCRVVYRTTSGLVGMGSRVTRPGDLVCRVRGLPVLMTVRRIPDSGTGAGADGPAPISCAHIGPTVVPARMKRGVVDGAEFGEKVAHFRIV
ncbi:heterokaryon incompatibility protein-domain-containing protein [Dactylonectria estremocensis]|uniref:Heterokaryon incompatibility protein-domain-containing protein n=1 Tax=Dactylonectria estremocensis TaxID=1079267 RepID=A0A9P9DRN2_9HYPO|nr:heterokaryon incompatibility protein-domain-containing protein [Dactylonectria estremocensis]